MSVPAQYTVMAAKPHSCCKTKKAKQNMLFKRSQIVRTHRAVFHRDVATLSCLLQEVPFTFWVAVNTFREG